MTADVQKIIIYKFMSYTTTIKNNIKCYKLVVHGYMFQPHCSQLIQIKYLQCAYSMGSHTVRTLKVLDLYKLA